MPVLNLWHYGNWPGTLDHLAISLVDYKHTVNIYRHVSTDSIGKKFVNLIQRLCLFNQ